MGTAKRRSCFPRLNDRPHGSRGLKFADNRIDNRGKFGVIHKK
jgi:hypothetical protein